MSKPTAKSPSNCILETVVSGGQTGVDRAGLDAAIEQGKALVELLKLHIFREDNVVLPMAHKYISQEEFDQIDNVKLSV